jgi:hypothetical protein
MSPRRRHENIIKTDLREVRYGDMDWIDLAQDRDKRQAFLRVPQNVAKLLTS